MQCNNSSPIHLKKFPVYASSLSDYSTEVKDFMTSLTFLPSLPPLLRAIRSSLLCSFMNIKDHRFASFFLHSCRFLGPTSTEMAGICYSIMGFHSLLYSSLYSEEKKKRVTLPTLAVHSLIHNKAPPRWGLLQMALRRERKTPAETH